MNINDYRKAMDHLIPDQELKERVMNQKASQRQYIPVRRVLTGALAAALTLACLFTVALAASPELRMAVMTFFHMEEPEHLPSADPGGALAEPGVSQKDIGQLVKAQYIEMDHYHGLAGDLLNDLTWSEDGRTLLDAKFWEVKDNEVIPVEVDLHTQQVDVTYNSIRYQGELYWYVRNGTLYHFKGSPFGVDTQPEDQWYVTSLSGRTDALLLQVSQGRQMEYTETTLLYHLDTGMAEELFVGVDPSILEQSDGSIWSPSASRALITGQAGPEFPNGREWLYDRESGTLTDVSALGNVGADMAVFVDDDTLILTAFTYDTNYDLEAIACWVYDIPSGQTVQTLAQSPYYHQSKRPYGIIPFYGSSCMELGQDGSVCLIDRTTGARTMVQNFTFEKGMGFLLNPSGTKLLYYNMDSDADGLGITQLGVIDLEKGTFIAFDRKGYEDLCEGSLHWQDDQTVSISADSSDGGTQYILLYQF